MKRYLRLLVPILIALVLVLGTTIPAMAATTADVTITATPTYLAMTISNSPNTWAIGTVVENTTYWWTADSLIPAEPLADGDMKETITNTGSVAEDFDVKCADFTGGVGWNISADDSPGADEVSVRAGYTGVANVAAMTQVINTDTELISNLAAAGTKMVCLSLETGTFGDGVAKSGTLTYTCRAVS
jgi:hypothetical protein